jgi:hypothetical protein
MGCPTEVEVGNDLVFSICTHDPDTGVLKNADGAPAYRVYEDDTATAILTGTMSALDGGNTTGFYIKKITCSVANGFDEGKSYSIYIEATVDGSTGGICYGFMVSNRLAEIEADISGILIKTNTLGGAGAIAWEYVLTEASTGFPISDADVWITTDIAGTNVIASGKTNIHGVATFYLDAGIIYVWRQKSGYNFDNPDVEDTSVDSTPGAGTDVVPPIAWTYTLTESSTGNPIVGATVRVTSDLSGIVTLDTQVTNGSGVATFSLAAGTVYVWRTLAGYAFDNPDVEVVT